MESKELLTQLQNAEESTPSSAFEEANLEQIIQEKGYEQGRLFLAKDRATYTLIYHDQVLSLHFDVDKKSLFLNGHKLNSLDDHPDLDKLLLIFNKELVSAGALKEFIAEFGASVSKLT